jgi:hypothetical protein
MNSRKKAQIAQKKTRLSGLQFGASRRQFLLIFSCDFCAFLRLFFLFKASASLTNRALRQAQRAHRTFRNRSETDPVAGT